MRELLAMSKQVDKFIDKLYGEIQRPKVKDTLEHYHIDFLVDCAIVKAREADRYNIDIPKER
jgi:hypothetical protein